MFGTGKVSEDSPWTDAGSITEVDEALDVDERDVATADALAAAKIIKINNQHPSAYALLLRVRSDGDADDISRLNLYNARGNDHYCRIATLSNTQGTQETDDAGVYFADKIAASNELVLFDGQEGGGSVSANQIDYYYIRTFGFDKFLLSCNSMGGTISAVHVDYCKLYE